MFKQLLTASFLIGCLTIGKAQTDTERQQIISTYDEGKIATAKAYLENMAEKNRAEVQEYLALNPSIQKTRVSNGEFVWLERIDRYGNPVFISTTNFNGGLTIGVNHLHSGGSLGLNIEGQGINAGLWDGGYARSTHAEFNDRVTFGETEKAVSDHGTHVGGTMISRGNNTQLKGMAPRGTIVSYRFDDDVSEMFNEAAAGLLLSNHSYGRLVDESTPVAVFGKYEETATSFDFVTNLYPYYLPVVSAGNDRNDGYNLLDNGYDILTDRTLSKNSMTVGAVEGIFAYSGPSSVKMSSFSSWGPTDDGRIKPDLVAKGVSVTSLGNDSDTSTATMSGTSMSSPMVTGGLMLLHQLFNQQEGKFMRSATVKGLALLTTKEAGDNPGPDYRFGWGLLDVEAAAKMILANNQSSTILERSLSSGGSYQAAFSTKGSNTLSFALSWTDQPGQAPSDAEDDPTPILVNDLDIKVTAADGTEYFPYKLDVNNPEAAATTGINNVDNIEIIKINAPAGDYTVSVTHKGSLLGSQAYSLLVNGATPKTASSRRDQITSLSMFPNPATNQFNITFSEPLNGAKILVNIYNSIGQEVLTKQFDNSGNFNQAIDIAGLSSGMYLVKIGDGNVSSTRKLIVR
ncbi:S8 family serine peptidase [Nonlabens marinus]|uniref:Uncharacterized protein n=1 Tax=Nonlabens marinus S1-08 TaxID=1454201 RepID=W8VSD8_9FLAO|nr:S8 family serine peptidase [Nonlabens marinus]BAO56160.1 hypothetical protein NMS_2151 [Nonlabens marinus S1-08]